MVSSTSPGAGPAAGPPAGEPLTDAAPADSPPRETGPGAGPGGATPSGTQPSAPPPHRRLVRTPDRRFAGVCAGLGHYLGIDPTIVRALFIVATFLGGSGLLIYGAGWVLMPRGTRADIGPPAEPLSRATTATVLGIAGLAIGAAILFDGNPFGGHLNGVASLLLVAGGVALLWQRPEPQVPHASPGAGPAAGTWSGAATGAGAGAGRFPTGSPSTPPVPTTGPWAVPLPADRAEGPAQAPPQTAGPAWYPSGHGPGWPGWAPPAATGPVTVAPSTGPRRSPERRRLPAGALALSLLVLAGGCALTAHLAGWATLGWPEAFAAGLLIVGTVAIVASFFGRARGIVPLGLLLIVGLLATRTTMPWSEGGIGERVEHPATVTELAEQYRLAVGTLELDTTGVQFPRGTTTTLDVRLGIGEADIRVPPDVVVVVDGHIGLGELRGLDGQTVNGADRDLRQRSGAVVTEPPPAGTDQPAVIVVKLRIAIGDGEVSRG